MKMILVLAVAAGAADDLSSIDVRQFLAAARAEIAAAPAPQETAPDVLLRGTTLEVLAILRQVRISDSADRAKIMELVQAKILPHFNFTRMTMLALGRSWRDASAAQQEALTSEFRGLLVRTYSRSLELYGDETVEVKPLAARAGDDEVTVKTLIRQNGRPPLSIDYRMEKTPQGWKVYDVIVEGISLVSNYRSQFGAEVQRGGIDGLIRALRDKNAGARN